MDGAPAAALAATRMLSTALSVSRGEEAFFLLLATCRIARAGGIARCPDTVADRIDFRHGRKVPGEAQRGNVPVLSRSLARARARQYLTIVAKAKGMVRLIDAY